MALYCVLPPIPDDLIMSCGGTLAKYASEGKRVISVVFSYGENTNPLLDPTYLTARLITESKKAFEILKSKTILLGLSDVHFKKAIEHPDIEKKIKNLLRRNKPKIVVIHDLEDPRPSHRAVSRLIMKIIEELKLKPRIYTFGIDLPFRLVHREIPKLYIDITSTFDLKQQALKLFKSQRELNIYQQLITRFRDTISGLRIGAKYAEVFYRL